MLVSLSTLLHGTLYEKLMWTFRVYDLNGDGVTEMEYCASAASMLAEEIWQIAE